MGQKNEKRLFRRVQESFAFRLILTNVLIFFVSLAIVSTVAYLTARFALTNQIGMNFLVQADDQTAKVTSFFLEKISQLQVISLSDIIRKAIEERNSSYSGSLEEIQSEINAKDKAWMEAPDDDPLIQNIISQDPSINPAANALGDFLAQFADHTEVFVTDRYGATVGATGRLSDYNQADEGWWQAAWNDGRGAIYISDPEYDESSGVTAAKISIPVYSEDGTHPIGVLRSTLVLDTLFAEFAGHVIGKTGHALLLDSKGGVIFDPRQDSVNSAGLSSELRQRLVSDEASFFVANDQNGRGSLFGHKRVSAEGATVEMGKLAGTFEVKKRILDAVAKLGWVAVIRQETSEAYASVESITRYILMTGLVALLLAGLGGYVSARSATQPLVALSNAATDFGAGKLDTPLPPIKSRDEIGRLTESFGTMAQQLRSLLASLEQRVAERTRVIETTAEVGRRISAILDTQQLTKEVVEQLHSAFGYYHTQIYLLDEAGENLVLAGGTGEAGQEMLRRGHRIPLGKGLVGRAAEASRPMIVPDTSLNPDWLPNPLLPDTRAEIAVPITIGGSVVGVLDVQHDRVGGLGSNDVALMQTIAGQVSLALQNARIVEQAQNRARREALLASIGQRIQGTASVQEALEVAVRELGRAIGKGTTTVRLVSQAEDTDGSAKGNGHEN